MNDYKNDETLIAKKINEFHLAAEKSLSVGKFLIRIFKTFINMYMRLIYQ